MEYVLISQQGSGTNLFRAIVNSHPNICFYDELFCVGRKYKWESYNHNGYESVETFINRKRKERDEDIVGFDLKYNQITPEIMEWLNKSNTHIIHFKRDPARTFIRNVNKENRNDFTYEKLDSYCKGVREWQKTIDKKFKDSNRYTEYYYEDMTRGQELETELPEFVKESLSNLLKLKKFNFSINKEDFIHKKLKMRF